VRMHINCSYESALDRRNQQVALLHFNHGLLICGQFCTDSEEIWVTIFLPPAMEQLNYLTSQNWVTSWQAEEYSRVRPKYPDSLFSFLASLTASHKVAWDVGTGNGQAAVAVRHPPLIHSFSHFERGLFQCTKVCFL
jgi:hypothetical protein